jgi:hypothetical protein
MRLTTELVRKICGSEVRITPRVSGGWTITFPSSGEIVADETELLSIVGDASTWMAASRLDEALVGSLEATEPLRKPNARESRTSARVGGKRTA